VKDAKYLNHAVLANETYLCHCRMRFPISSLEIVRPVRESDSPRSTIRSNASSRRIYNIMAPLAPYNTRHCSTWHRADPTKIPATVQNASHPDSVAIWQFIGLGYSLGDHSTMAPLARRNPV